MDINIVQIINDSMISSVKTMKKCSLTSAILTNLYLILLLIIHEFDDKNTINFLKYYPLFSCISSTCFSLNFARNREFIKEKYYLFTQHLLKIFKNNQGTKTKHNLNNSISINNHNTNINYIINDELKQLSIHPNGSNLALNSKNKNHKVKLSPASNDKNKENPFLNATNEFETDHENDNHHNNDNDDEEELLQSITINHHSINIKRALSSDDDEKSKSQQIHLNFPNHKIQPSPPSYIAIHHLFLPYIATQK